MSNDFWHIKRQMWDSVFSRLFLNRAIWKAAEMIEILKRSYLVLKELDETFKFSSCRWSNMSSETLWYKGKISVLVFFSQENILNNRRNDWDIRDRIWSWEKSMRHVFDFSSNRLSNMNSETWYRSEISVFCGLF